MANNIDDLPDDMISHILSFLNIRDIVRARLTSPRWLNLSDSRSSIDINFETVVGEFIFEKSRRRATQPQFIKIVNRFMQLWSGNRLTTLTIMHGVNYESIGEIEKWIAKAFSMKVECIDIRCGNICGKKFDFPCTAIQREYKPHLKRLCLFDCTPSFLNFGYTRWLSKLTTMRLVRVPLDSERMELIFSSAPNLVALELIKCEMGELRIDGQLLHLKKLEIIDDLVEVRISCPSLELFWYSGRLDSLRFIHVSVLREAEMYVKNMDLCSEFFNDIQAPSLETLLTIQWIEISPVPPSLVRYGLKKLKLDILGGFDLLSIKYLLNACPHLEELEVKLSNGDKSNPEIGVIGRREYWDQRKHRNLRKVKIERFYEHWNATKLAKYILRNAVALEEMEIVIPRGSFVLEYYQSLRVLKEKVNPTARFVVSHIFSENIGFGSYWRNYG